MTEQTMEQLVEELKKLQEENAKLKEAGRPKLGIKVAEPRAAGTYGTTDKGSAGGAVSVYGIQRFPVTLYKEQWLKLLGMADEILGFLTEHAKELAVKPVK